MNVAPEQGIPGNIFRGGMKLKIKEQFLNLIKWRLFSNNL